MRANLTMYQGDAAVKADASFKRWARVHDKPVSPRCCPYCGVPLKGSSQACYEHRDLPGLERA